MKAALPIIVALMAICSTRAQDRPNILWIVAEDTSPWMGCYGHEVNMGFTPNIDRMADQGVQFTRAYVAAPVCSSSRSALITGVNPIRFNAHEHRSKGSPLPEGWKTVPEWLQQAGYRTFNMGKLDYNFQHDLLGLYPENAAILKNKTGKVKNAGELLPWRKMPLDKPFFGQIQLTGGKQGGKQLMKEGVFDPNKLKSEVTVPGDYPDNDMYRKLIAQHYIDIRGDDQRIGRILDALEADGLLEKTIVVYISDHSAPTLVRHKQQPTEGGLHVPFVAIGPKKWIPQGQKRNDLVSLIDLSATTLAWAGLEIPDYIEGRDLFATDFKPRTFVGAQRDRCDFTIERIRTIRTDRYRYTRNYMLDRTLLQPQYRDKQDYVQFLRKSYADGTLDKHLAEIYFGERPAEELYDVVNDPAQLQNLVNSPNYQKVLAEHRELLEQWLAKGDSGIGDEPDRELNACLKNKIWTPVNPEYEHLRKDSDGDGLSDTWESLNDRDPADGKLLHRFDCGGWQTEGWTSKNTTNLAGRQGFLNFDLIENTATLERDGYRLTGGKNNEPFELRARSAQPVSVSLLANNVVVGQTQIDSKEFKTYSIKTMPKAWQGTIETLALKLEGQKSTQIEIDWMKIGQDQKK